MLWHFNQYGRNRNIENVENLFSRIFGVGIIALVVNVVQELLKRLYDNYLGPLPAEIRAALDLCGYLASLWFFLITAVYYKKLVFVKLYTHTLRHWHWFLGLLIISATGLFYYTHFPGYIFLVVLLAGLVVILLLIFRIKWVAMVKEKTQYFAIFYLASIIVISTGLVQELFGDDLSYIVHGSYLHNGFYILLCTFVIGYSIFSLLALLFNLPLSSVAQSRLREIRSFQQISRGILRHQPLENTMERLFKICMQNSDAEAGWLWLSKGEDHQGNILHTSQINRKQIESLDKQINFLHWLEKNRRLKVISIPNLKRGEFMPSEDFPYNSLAALPIYFQSKLLGCIYLLREMGGSFDDHCLDMLKSYITQTKISLENVSLIQAAVKNARASQELSIARRVQKSLMPHQFSAAPGLNIAASNHTSSEVGGDYYDIDIIPPGHLACIIADVSGSGISAAFHMAELKGIFRLLIRLDLPFEQLISKANRAVSDCLPRAYFITATCLVIHKNLRRFTYVRCGHTPVLLYRAVCGKAVFLEDKGLGLGIIRSDRFNDYIEIREVKIDEGDIILLFTDGICEGVSNDSEYFGQERLARLVEENAGRSAEEIKDSILLSFSNFRDATKDPDDYTLLIIKIGSQ